MKLQELFNRLNNLKRIPRTGWLLCNVSLEESEDVAQHIFDVVTMTLMLADELEHRRIKINKELALSMAVVHDWAEALIGDYPYPALKHLESKEAKKRIEQNALTELLGDLPQKERYVRLWREYVEKRTLESKLVHTADYLSILVQAVKYRERGNWSPELNELWYAVDKDLEPYTKEFPWINDMKGELKKRFFPGK
ncbi:MAG TPA: HD domain-containing protein [Hadesarchaea archaeon]|nr:HD domain-containing protein [Hadesarchaea archaeon]